MADESSVSKPAITGDVEIPEGAPTMAATPSVSKPDITGDVEIAAESPAPYTTSASSLPQSIGGRSGPPPRRASTTGEEGDVKLKIAGVAIDISEKQVPMLGMLLSSMVNVMAACLSVDPTHRYYEYAVSVGPVGMVLSSVGLLLSWKTTWDQGSLSKWISALCFLWSFIAAGVLTFGRGPFVETGNGYFSSWGMALFSVQTMGITAKHMKESAYDGTSLLGLGLFSIVLIIALSSELVDDKTYKVNMMYSLILSIVTLIFVERLRDFDATIKSAVITCFAVMWVAAATLMTFDGPFTTTGNGYFAAWGAAITCVFAANDQFLEMVVDWLNRNILSNVKHFAGLDEGTGGPYAEDVSTEDKFQLAIDMPGVTMGDVDVQLDGHMLIVSGTRNADDAVSARTMTKSFALDLDTVDTSNITATLQNGVLFVAAPKTKKAMKQIAIVSE